MTTHSAQLCQQLNIQYPIIMAPMFLVSNLEMMKAGMEEGIMSVFPTLNFRNEGELTSILDELNTKKSLENTTGNYGVNLIVQLSNPMYEKHLVTCVEKKVPFYITSLGNPKKVIEQAHSYGAKVYCDVTNIVHAAKVQALGCDGFVAVGAGAGGHAGKNALHVLIEGLKEHFPNTPVLAAGGIASGKSLLAMEVLGASGVSVGTRFIASSEAQVSADYKNGIVDAGMDDIVLSEKISGTPCSIINTPYAQKIGYKQGWLEKLLAKNRTVRKYFKMLVQLRGMKKLENSIKQGTYKTLWCAGQSVEMIKDIKSIKDIVAQFKKEYQQALKNFSSTNS